MVVSVDSFKRLPGHSEEAGSIPNWNTTLHQPCRTGVPEDMRCHVGKCGPIAGRGETALDVFQPAAGFVDDEPQLRPPLSSSTQMAQ